MTINSPIIIIPSRMASTRLPNKPLADINGKPIYKFDSSITKPKNLKEILELSSQIAQLAKAPYVRIDLFNIDEEKIKFGEVTFHHMSGMAPIIPLDWDFKLGKRLVL